MNRLDLLSAFAALALPLALEEPAAAADAPQAGSAADVVAREVAAFNAHDAAAVTALHASNATLTALPDSTVVASGAAALHAFFAKTFHDNPNVKLTLERQVVLKTVVVNLYTAPGPGRILSLYDVRNGLIAKEWFMLG